MNRSDSCIFCKIVAGAIPAARVYEDDAVLAFLDIGPLAEGHVLVVPKDHAERLDTMSPDAVAAAMRVLPPLARAMCSVTGATAYNVLLNVGRAAGQEVPHVHFHLIPQRGSDGLGYRWKSGTYPAGRIDVLAAEFRAALDRGA